MGSLADELNNIAWAEYRTAYGPAHDVPIQIQALYSNDCEARLDAAHELWCALCHQRTYITDAALPALPFLLDALDQAPDHVLQIELLEILLGFARCTTRTYQLDQPLWAQRLRQSLLTYGAKLKQLRANPHPEVSDLADATFNALGQP
ncbi:hypothetical protein [Deinococcus pimensis]|uniref:hypothetical protein n=1 Tax=Deinococcus pimensis TaxID=309888 RepID=UPI0012FC1376|nr:hypothetical protein [Deinococcus pimensis]